MKGRLLGGCIDTMRHLIGTPYGDVQEFQQTYIQNEPIVWYLENCELSATDFHRTLMQMQQSGWFDHVTGIIFGRTSAGQEVGGFTTLDALERLAETTKSCSSQKTEMNSFCFDLPTIYNMDLISINKLIETICT